MRPAPGDVVYAFVNKRPPSRRRVSVRFGVQRPVLRLTPWSVTDERGNDWICVLPVPRGVAETRLNPHSLRWIPVDNVCRYKESLSPEVLEVVCDVLEGDDPRYPWITPDGGRALQPGTGYPTVREAVQGRF